MVIKCFSIVKVVFYFKLSINLIKQKKYAGFFSNLIKLPVFPGPNILFFNQGLPAPV